VVRHDAVTPNLNENLSHIALVADLKDLSLISLKSQLQSLTPVLASFSGVQDRCCRHQFRYLAPIAVAVSIADNKVDNTTGRKLLPK
jgi:hypothetical protein